VSRIDSCLPDRGCDSPFLRNGSREIVDRIVRRNTKRCTWIYATFCRANDFDLIRKVQDYASQGFAFYAKWRKHEHGNLVEKDTIMSDEIDELEDNPTLLHNMHSMDIAVKMENLATNADYRESCHLL
jgi:hypothetical protein